jgi:enoyl-CoA hydratase/carnithine racemase
MVLEEWAMPLDEAIDAEAIAQARCMETEDFRLAYEAFLEKRPPEFVGR